MTQRISYAALLLFSSALVAPPALAQDGPGSGSAQTNPDVDPDIEGIEDEPGETPGGEDVDISGPGSNFGNEIIVRGKFIPNPIRATPEVVSVLGTEEIARTAEGDIAGSLSRVTGLSVVGGRFVFVRGLGERYSLALLNGLPLPSPEPLRRVVPLDLFPTSVIASTVVQKSYSVNYPGEFGGGVINLTTKKAPEESFLEISAGISGDSETTAETGYTYAGSNRDWTGFDSGVRKLPPAFASLLSLNVPISAGTLLPDGSTLESEDLVNLAASLNNAQTSLILRNREIPANFSGEVSAGTKFDVGEAVIGVFATGGYSNAWRSRSGQQQSASGIVQIDGQDGLGVDDSFRYLTTDQRIIINGMLNFSAEIGDHQLRFTNLYIHDTVKEANVAQGSDQGVAAGELINKGRTTWFERQLFSTQFVGEFDFDPLSVDIRASYSNSKREAPYERTYSYVFDDTVANDFVNDLTDAGQSARISFSDLNDDVYGGGIDLAYKLPTSMPIELSAGYSYYLNERTSSRRDFRFFPTNGLPDPVNQERIDYLLSPATIRFYGIELRESASQQSAPAYDAELEVHAGYVQADAELMDGLRLNLGVRFEDGTEIVNPVALGAFANFQSTRIEESYWLPAATLTWNFADDMQLRFAASKTIARPQFRELARQQFFDNETDRILVGNPFLTDSELLNFEARYEYYIGAGERITVAGFYKDIDRPIENVAIKQGGDALFTGFSNAPSATLYGVETELVKYFPLYEWIDGAFFEERRLLLAANYTYTKSEIKVGAGDTAISPATLTETSALNLFDDGDPLTGQSDHVVNVQFGMEGTGDLLSQQTILVTYNSPRVTARGPGGQPDLVERSGVRLDAVLREELNIAGRIFEVKFEARNLLGKDYIERQKLNDSIIVNNSYDVGRSYSFSVKTEF